MLGKWGIALLLSTGLLLAVLFFYNSDSNRDDEVFWETKIAELTGVKVAIEDVEKTENGGLIFSNIKVFNHPDFTDLEFINIPTITSTLGRGNQHFIVDIQKPKINYFHSGEESNASKFFREIRRMGYKEQFTNSDEYKLEFKVTEPEMQVYYSRETGKKHILTSIVIDSQQYEFNTEYATLRQEVKSFKLKVVKGVEGKVAAKAGAYFLSKIDMLGNKPLVAYENKYKQSDEMRRLQSKVYKNEDRVNLNVEKQKQPEKFKYEPQVVR